jgi:hypothetical protein
MSVFLFTDDPAAVAGKETLLLMVPAGLADKQAVLAWYAGALRFPSYFGENWDAFNDCLNDLSWIAEKNILISHHDMPLTTAPADRSIYLDVLANAVHHWADDEGHNFSVSFPEGFSTPLECSQ